MNNMLDQPSRAGSLNDAEMDELREQSQRMPPADATGDVDISLVEHCVRLSPAQRFEHHYHARMLAERLRRAGERHYGSSHPDPEAA